ncbi:MAG: TIGR01777 family protein [Acidobacteria bacterium]|nr:TIGR01777 family protein [Acidobacteriota bacterium]
MKAEIFVYRTLIEAPAGEVFAWHTWPGVIERLTPPWERVKVLERTGGIENGARVALRMKAGPLGMRWVAEHRDYVEGRQFKDVQIAGPFRRWEHTHLVEPDGPAACYLEDRIEYALPLGLGLARGHVRRRLERLFRYRHRTTAEDIAAHMAHRGAGPMRILVSGSTGLIGSALIPFLQTGEHEVVRLVRSKPKPPESIRWAPEDSFVDEAGLRGIDAVVHLAGESIAGGRWTKARKARIYLSRVEGTRLLTEALARMDRPPRVMVCASAIGYYGDRGDELLEEDSGHGRDFLAGLCVDWEAAVEPAWKAGVRVVSLRTGIVLSPAGGALAKMLPPFRMGLGGRFGSGEQYMSWISLDDQLGAILHALATGPLEGPVNATAPNPMTNRRFTETLAKVLARPALFPVPAAAARLAFGEMAQALLLASQRVVPAKLLATEFRFRHPELEGALRHLLGRSKETSGHS